MLYSDITELVVLRKLCMNIGSNLASRVIDLIDKEDMEGLIDLSINPADYESAYTFANDYMIVKFLSKWQGFIVLSDREPKKVAIDLWKEVEAQNRETNLRLSKLSYTPFDSILHTARNIILQILGDLDKPRILDRSRWSNGATCAAKHGTPLDTKISNYFDVTSKALPYAKLCIEHDPDWYYAITGVRPDGPFCCTRSLFKIVDYNRHVTVPKTAKTDRSICAEPTLNAFMQQGVLHCMNDKLRRHGIRLDDQSINQRYAARAVFEGLATVDLQNASDSLTTQLVYNLLPFEWASFLDDLRCKATKIEGSIVQTEKFCSMGNAFTFPLQSLIFYAVGRSVAEHLGVRNKVISVFGDDIIINRECYQLLKEVFAHIGFTINNSKSYYDGRFFESCGKHYFDGFDVTPIYQKNTSGDGLHETIRMTNRIVRWSIRVGGDWNSPSIKGIFRLLTKGIKNGPFIPVGPSDDGFIVPTSWLHTYDYNHGYYCRVYTFVQKLRRKTHEPSLYACKLRNPTYSNSASDGSCATGSGRGVWKYQNRYFGVHGISYNAEPSEE